MILGEISSTFYLFVGVVLSINIQEIIISLLELESIKKNDQNYLKKKNLHKYYRSVLVIISVAISLCYIFIKANMQLIFESSIFISISFYLLYW